MNVYKNICFFFGMMVVANTAYSQKASKTYFHPAASLNIDTIFIPASNGFISNTNYVWLNTLNSQYVDTSKNQVNSATVPAYVPIKKSSLLNPYSPANQIICAMLPYGYYFPSTQYGRTAYDIANKPYLTVPYGYSPYHIKATVTPHYKVPKF